jgi:hypothetical protein
MNQTPASNDDEMPAEVDFSGGTRGKFHRPGATLALPVYLETEVQARLALLANAKGIDFCDRMSMWISSTNWTS